MRSKEEVEELLEQFMFDPKANGGYDRADFDSEYKMFCCCGAVGDDLLRWLDKRGIPATVHLGFGKIQRVSNRACVAWLRRYRDSIDHCVVVLDGWAMDPTCAQFGQTRKVYPARNFLRCWKRITLDWKINKTQKRVNHDSYRKVA